MQPLNDKVAIVAGGTRGAGRGIATELGAAGAIVYVTGRSTRTHRSEYVSSGQLAKVYGFTDLDGSQPDAWRYIQEVTEMGKPADATGYR
ncbi:hypothetical protein ACN4EK_31490 [Pantanalinema rosaneae CENA516]|uniref:hypothetical protein n=1 Tax=Pantanalinema rosaneae TaxID=1620701 RepID=UPI003D6F043F